MWRVLIFSAALLMVIALASSRGVGQGTLPPAPAPAPDEEVKPLPTPPAWKSVEVGNFYLHRKKYRAALSRFQEAAKTDPYNPQAYLGMGTVYDRLGLKQKALDNYRKYLDLLPSAKEAEDAKEVQKAIARLEGQLKVRKKAGTAATSTSAPTNP
ncbi:MAG: hypothetical protein ACE145_14785 [Terriglobia bacterium]